MNQSREAHHTVRPLHSPEGPVAWRRCMYNLVGAERCRVATDSSVARGDRKRRQGLVRSEALAGWSLTRVPAACITLTASASQDQCCHWPGDAVDGDHDGVAEPGRRPPLDTRARVAAYRPTSTPRDRSTSLTAIWRASSVSVARQTPPMPP
jgi:hypothetical protein